MGVCLIVILMEDTELHIRWTNLKCLWLAAINAVFDMCW